MVKIKFLGASETVTGSCYLVQTDRANFLVDCGMFQGPDVEHLNLEEFNFNPKEIDFVLLTHAHIDHSGMLPKLFKEGFAGSIFATHNTISIATELLLDSAKLQEKAYEKGESYGKYTNIRALVYNTSDALKTISLFKPVSFLADFFPSEKIKVKYIRAGHILGAATIEVEINDNNEKKSILFSGDIGRVNSKIDDTFDLDYKISSQYILMESLYGGIVHQDRDESTKSLIEIIKKTISRGGSVFIPSFAVQRTQEILNDLKKAKEEKSLDENINVWLDSPLAQRITKIYNLALQNEVSDPFNFKNLIYIKKYKQSLKVSQQKGQVIIAGSGMADGGRIMDHLVTALPNNKNSIVFVGFQAEGTLGREIVNGAKSVRIDTKQIKINAQIHHLEGFSAHGDTEDYRLWIGRVEKNQIKKIFLIHAEIHRSLDLKKILESEGYNNIVIPKLKEEVLI